MMQGRLSPKEPDALQSFPASNWEQEFDRAAQLGFGGIEWLIDSIDLETNPLFSNAVPHPVIDLSERSGVAVPSLCAHFLIDRPLYVSGTPAAGTLIRVLETASMLGIRNVIVPVLEGSTVSGDTEKAEQLASAVRHIADAAPANIRICLELDLPASATIALLSAIDRNSVGVCYDIGNATASGFDAVKEIVELAGNIFEIHIKDRLVGGSSQPLGHGETPIADAVQAARASGYDGWFVFETPVGSDWKSAARANLETFRGVLAEYADSRP